MSVSRRVPGSRLAQRPAGLGLDAALLQRRSELGLGRPEVGAAHAKHSAPVGGLRRPSVRSGSAITRARGARLDLYQ